MIDNETNKIQNIETENIGKIGIVKITKNLINIIDYLHYKVGSTEWSGILFYKITKGNISKFKDLEFTADFVYPMDIGSATYTEYDHNKDASLNEDLVKAYDIYEKGLESSRGHLHSHHNMSTFFSGTDMDELKSNATLYNYYLSIIVNFSKKYSAKIAIPVESDVTIVSMFKDTLGKLIPFNQHKKSKSVLIGDLDMVIEGETYPNKWLEERVQKLKDKKISSYKCNNYTDEYINDNKYKGITTNWDNYLSEKFKKAKNTAIPTIHTPATITETLEPIVSLLYDKLILTLLSIDAIETFSTVHQAFTVKKSLSTKQLDIFENAVDENIEIIVTSIFGEDCNFRKVCMEALLHLHDNYANAYDKLKVFEIIDYTLSCYVAV